MVEETNKKIQFASEKKNWIIEKIILYYKEIFLRVYLVVKHSVITVLWETCFLLLLRSEVSADHYLVKQSGKVSFEKIFPDSPPHTNIF